MTAVELVERMGVPVRRAASILGLAPSAVSQYVTGSRRGGTLDRLSTNPEAQAITRRLAHFLLELPKGREHSPRPLLEAASRMSELLGGLAPVPAGAGKQHMISRSVSRRLRARVVIEQAAVSECMHLAQKAEDELTRAVFRQIASDSLRHAEIMATLAGYLDSGVDQTLASGVTQADVEQLMRKEREAEQKAAWEIRRHVGGVMALLVESMQSDEKKHEELLKGLLAKGFGR
jgi:hypothetical protein